MDESRLYKEEYFNLGYENREEKIKKRKELYLENIKRFGE
jgi:hypothetical protein